jgi:tetratricopeptide (TPR) repeat protein
MQLRIRERVQKRPQDPSAWRMLGKVQQQNGEPNAAEKSFRKALELGPLNAAAHHDLGLLLMEQQRQSEGLEELLRVVELAPDSEYAQQAKTHLNQWGIEPEPPREDEPLIELAGYEAGEFDGSQLRKETENPIYEPIPDPADVFDISFDVGFRYNSNVALAPTSRQLVPGDRESFQLLLSPDLEWTFWERDNSRWGATYYGQWTFNEGSFRNFNLESYQPGAFWERDFDDGQTLWIPRIAYDFIHDEFDGVTYGNRNQVTTSLLALWNDIDSTYFYYSADYSAFLNDGSAPAFTSQDGWRHSLGASHEWYWKDRRFRSFTLGADLQHVETAGSDYRFNGIQLYAESLFVPVETWNLTLGGGVGYRDYYDFVGPPSRDEYNLRGTIELEKEINEHFSIVGLFQYQTFNSENPLFDADQFLGGILTKFEF